MGTSGSGVILSGRYILTSAHVLSSAANIPDLQRSIREVSRLRFSLAHENAHVLLTNGTGMTADIAALRWLASTPPGNDRLDVTSVDVTLAAPVFASPYDETPARPWSRRVGVPVSVSIETSASPRMPYGMPTARIWSKSREDALTTDSKAALLRLVDGILAALCLMLILVLAALSRHPATLTFVLVMLAACRRYGRRAEPDDYAFLPTRRNRTSWGAALTYS